MESDEVYTTVEATQQFDNLASMGCGVVKTCKTDVLERTTALMAEVVLLQQLDNIGYRHLLLGRHQLLALLGQR